MVIVPSQSLASSAAVDAVASARAAFESGRTRGLDWREAQLDGLLRLLDENEELIADAARLDIGRPDHETWMSEVAATRREVNLARKRCRRWSRRTTVLPGWRIGVGARILREPLGVVLVMGPWNYAVQLLLVPLASALAAGNTAVVKPSELASNTSALLADLLPRYLDAEATRVVEGGAEVATDLLGQRFDHTFFTGGAAIGRIVAHRAAEHLTPVTLELGGKSPVIVDRDCDLATAARRVAWGRFLNAGQTCVAPDYVLVHAEVERQFLDALVGATNAMFGDQPELSADFGRIVNTAHFDRVADLIDRGGYDSIAVGGGRDRDQRYVAPTVLAGVSPDAAIMTQEIFGPVLPVLRVQEISQAISFVNDRDKPLALYVFSRSADTVDRVLAETSSGGACVNDVVMHLGLSGLPLGGVGASGYGAYHGRWGFETFSHRRAVFKRSTRLEMAAVYAPYRGWKRRLMRRVL
jgi:aldehyde dehydrogenase (NAD+)